MGSGGGERKGDRGDWGSHNSRCGDAGAIEFVLFFSGETGELQVAGLTARSEEGQLGTLGIPARLHDCMPVCKGRGIGYSALGWRDGDNQK